MRTDKLYSWIRLKSATWRNEIKCSLRTDQHLESIVSSQMILLPNEHLLPCLSRYRINEELKPRLAGFQGIAYRKATLDNMPDVPSPPFWKSNLELKILGSYPSLATRRRECLLEHLSLTNSLRVFDVLQREISQRWAGSR